MTANDAVTRGEDLADEGVRDIDAAAADDEVSPSEHSAAVPEDVVRTVRRLESELITALAERDNQLRRRVLAAEAYANRRVELRAGLVGTVWFVAAVALAAASAWMLIVGGVPAEWTWASSGLALVLVVIAVWVWQGAGRARKPVRLRLRGRSQRPAGPDLYSELWFDEAHRCRTPRAYRRVFVASKPKT